MSCFHKYIRNCDKSIESFIVLTDKKCRNIHMWAVNCHQPLIKGFESCNINYLLVWVYCS